MKLYHYSNVKFSDIDMSKCDGFWMTTIAPTQTELLKEIGAFGVKYCAVIEFDNSGEELLNGSNSDVEDQLNAESADYMKNAYDGFSDYATVNSNLIKIIEWVNV